MIQFDSEASRIITFLKQINKNVAKLTVCLKNLMCSGKQKPVRHVPSVFQCLTRRLKLLLVFILPTCCVSLLLLLLLL